MADPVYRIFETDRFLRDLAGFDQGSRSRVQSKLHAFVYPRLRVSPRKGPWMRRLVDWAPETWRFRIGPYRLFYEIDDRRRMIFMTAIADRKDAY